MKPDKRNRNIVVGGGYLLLLIIILTNLTLIFGLLLFVVPIAAAVLVGRNYRNSAEELSRIPGISASGGILTGASAFVLSFVLMAILATSVMAIAPIDTNDTNGDTDDATSDVSDGDDEMHTVTVYVSDEGGDALENADVEFTHDDAIIFNTRENVETDSEGMASFETESGSDVEITAEASGYEEADASLTISQDEEVTLTLAEVPAESEETEETEADETEDADEAEEADEDTASVGEQETDEPETDGADEQEIEEAEEEFEEQEEEDSLSDEAEEETGAQITADDAEALLAANGLDVTADETGDGVVMEYHDTVADENELAENLGAIAGTHAAWYEDDPSIGSLTIEMYNSQTGEHAGTTSVDEGTTEAYINDEISSYEYSYELLTGLESNE